MNSIIRFLKSEDGPTAVEYAVMLALILVSIIGAVNQMIGAAKASFENSATAIDNL